jgi:hypothetical protein
MSKLQRCKRMWVDLKQKKTDIMGCILCELNYINKKRHNSTIVEVYGTI